MSSTFKALIKTYVEDVCFTNCLRDIIITIEWLPWLRMLEDFDYNHLIVMVRLLVRYPVIQVCWDREISHLHSFIHSFSPFLSSVCLSVCLSVHLTSNVFTDRNPGYKVIRPMSLKDKDKAFLSNNHLKYADKSDTNP